MRPNYKKLAEEYSNRWRNAEERLSCAYKAEQLNREYIVKVKNENEDLKIKYSKALDKIIELQEMIRGKEV